MNKPSIPEDEVSQILCMRKYRTVGIPKDTLTSLFSHEEASYHREKEVIASVKVKLHHIIAPYLDRLDYSKAHAWVDALPRQGFGAQIKQTCSRILSEHVSTQERMQLVPGFFETLFGVSGKPKSIIDLACGLNPFFIPWMDLEKDVRYHAIDLHGPRIDLINLFFQRIRFPQLGIHEDFLLHPPRMDADVAFLFKEAHRLEQRQRGCNLPLWKELKVKWLMVSLPTQNITGTRTLVEKHRSLVKKICQNEPWQITELVFANEIVFCIRKK